MERGGARHVWRERDAREHDIADATPVPDAVSLIGKSAGLVLLLVTMQAVLIGTGMATQVASGYYDVQPLLWLRVLMGIKLVDYVLFVAMAMGVQVVVNQNYLGTALVMLLWVFPQYAGGVVIEHNLLIYGASPAVTYSEISGFGASLVPWFWFKLYWGGSLRLLQHEPTERLRHRRRGHEIERRVRAALRQIRHARAAGGRRDEAARRLASVAAPRGSAKSPSGICA